MSSDLIEDLGDDRGVSVCLELKASGDAFLVLLGEGEDCDCCGQRHHKVGGQLMLHLPPTPEGLEAAKTIENALLAWEEHVEDLTQPALGVFSIPLPKGETMDLPAKPAFPPVTPEQLSDLNILRDMVADNAKTKGFRDVLRDEMTQKQWEGSLGRLVRAAVFTANQHGEASEFWEAFRAGRLNELCDKAHKMEELGLPPLTCAEEEIADEIIRALDKAEAHGVDVARAVAVKMSYNSTRSHLHGNKKA